VGTERVITELTDHLEQTFRRWPEFEMRPRLASHSPLGVIELMPTADIQHFAFKFVNGHPSNPARGFQTVTAFGALAEVDNGYPVLLSEMTLLTALRTAATSALAARYLAPHSARTAALVGTGCQAPFQALGLRAELGIEDLAVFDVDPRAMNTFTGHAEALGFRVRRAPSAADAVRDAQVVTTCTADKRMATILHDPDIGRSVHVNAIGGDCPGKTELDAGLLQRAAVVAVELPEQTRIEGEIQQMSADFPVTELWRIIVGDRPGRTHQEELTIFDSVGFAIEDFAALRYLQETLAGTDYLEDIDLVAAPTDPKDLFSLVAGVEASALVTDWQQLAR
jgi:ornithine cyclodeaminase